MGAVSDFELPFPPSLNHYYRHVGPRVLISREGRIYREKVAQMLGKREVFEGALSIELEFYPPDYRRRDLDNLLKCTFDTLQHAGVYRDDSQIAKLTAYKHQPLPPHGAAFIRIKNYDPSKQLPPL